MTGRLPKISKTPGILCQHALGLCKPRLDSSGALSSEVLVWDTGPSWFLLKNHQTLEDISQKINIQKIDVHQK